MDKYVLTMEYVGLISYEVEADSLDEAEELAIQRYEEEDAPLLDKLFKNHPHHDVQPSPGIAFGYRGADGDPRQEQVIQKFKRIV